MYMPATLKGHQKRERVSDDALGLELSVVMSCCVGAGNQIWVLCEDSQCA